MVDHKKHRNILYILVIVVGILQITSFIVLMVQLTRLDVQLNNRIQQTKGESKEYTNMLMKKYDAFYQENFGEISRLLAQQQENIQQELSLIKSSQEDFSGIVQDVIKSVVTVSTFRSVGSGFLVNPSGFVVTNYHVIAGNEDNVLVLTYDRKRYPAEYLGGDEVRDLALLKIDGSFGSLDLADSDQLQVGRKVIAIGNPLGLSSTVTEGIISALKRRGPNDLSEYIQTDVSLNPGNSGGPLIDTTGRVVGMNNFKIGGAESLGFALESNAIKQSVNEILNQSLLA